MKHALIVAALLAALGGPALATTVTVTTPTVVGQVPTWDSTSGDVAASTGIVPITTVGANKILGNNTGSLGGITEIGVTGTFGSVVLSVGPTFTGVPKAAGGFFNIETSAAQSVLAIKRTDNPGANGYIGNSQYVANNSAAAAFEYAAIYGQVLDPTSGSEDGSVAISTSIAGALGSRLTVANGITVGAPTGGLKGDGTINAASTYYANNTAGVTCAAGISNTTGRSVNGIVTAC